MDYLLDKKDQHKYDNVKSRLLWGSHQDCVEYSIVIPTYNRPKLLKESLYSALDQNSRVKYEIIVVDNYSESEDCSPTYKLIESISDNRIVYYKNEENIGIYGNTLRGYQLAHGEYVILLNDDDILHPFYLNIMDSLINQYHFYGVIGSLPCDFCSKPDINHLPTTIRAYKISEIAFFTGTCVTSPGFLFPKKILYDIHNSYEELLMGDQIIQYKALSQYGLYMVDFPIAFYRVGENETIKDSVLMDMMEHMCLFKRQISHQNLALNCYMKLFFKNFCQLYVTGNAKFWHKEKLIIPVLNRLNVRYYAEDSIKQLIAERIFRSFSSFAVRKRRKYYIVQARIIYDYENRAYSITYK